MKELSINEKAKAYDEAIKRAKKIYGNGIIKRIFPELKEGDDERIKKNCIHFLKLQKQHHAATFEIEECIDWLEKQGKQLADKNKQIFKDGDIVATNTGNWIGITTGGHANSYMPTYCVLSHNREVKLYFGRKKEWGFNRLATEEEKQRLFDAIKERGYNWNAETKTLDKLVEPKFDPKTLEAFDRVLVRLTKDAFWNATFFSHYDKELNWGCHPCVTTSCKSYDKCIPYNDETKHLLGTSDEAPEYYRYWED